MYLQIAQGSFVFFLNTKLPVYLKTDEEATTKTNHNLFEIHVQKQSD